MKANTRKLSYASFTKTISCNELDAYNQSFIYLIIYETCLLLVA